MPGQQQRKKSVRQKLNPVELEFKDKMFYWWMIRLYVVQPVMKSFRWRVIQVQRKYFCLRRTDGEVSNVYGIDMPAKSELIASDRTVEKFVKLLVEDRLIFRIWKI